MTLAPLHSGHRQRFKGQSGSLSRRPDLRKQTRSGEEAARLSESMMNFTEKILSGLQQQATTATPIPHDAESSRRLWADLIRGQRLGRSRRLTLLGAYMRPSLPLVPKSTPGPSEPPTR